MRIRSIAAIVLGLTLPVAALSVSAFAQSAPASTTATAGAAVVDVRSACKADMDKLCATAERGDARRSCIDANKDKFSDSCKSARAAADSRREAFRAACSGDIAKLCANVEKGRGAAVECVRANAEKVTPSCKTQLSQLPTGGQGGEATIQK